MISKKIVENIAGKIREDRKGKM